MLLFKNQNINTNERINLKKTVRVDIDTVKKLDELLNVCSINLQRNVKQQELYSCILKEYVNYVNDLINDYGESEAVEFVLNTIGGKSIEK